MQISTFIYGLIDPRDNKIKYIGKSNNPHNRLSSHLCEMGMSICNLKVNWFKNLSKENLRPEIIILDEVSMNEWQFWETWWYELFKSWGFELKNSDTPGKGGSYKTIEQKEKASQALKGKNWVERFGEEKAALIIEKHKKTKQNKTKEEKQKTQDKRKQTLKENPDIMKRIAVSVSEFRKGKTLGEILKNISVDELKNKISEGLKKSEKWKEGLKNRDFSGTKNPKYRGKIYQYSKDRKTLINEWESLVEIQNNFPKGQGDKMANISGVCNGKAHSAYGFWWTREKI